MTATSPLRPRSARGWRLAARASGATLMLAILLGLGAVTWRMRRTLALLDGESPDGAELVRIQAHSLLCLQWSLALGLIAFAAHLPSIVMCHRARRQERQP